MPEPDWRTVTNLDGRWTIYSMTLCTLAAAYASTGSPVLVCGTDLMHRPGIIERRVSFERQVTDTGLTKAPLFALQGGEKGLVFMDHLAVRCTNNKDQTMRLQGGRRLTCTLACFKRCTREGKRQGLNG